MVIPLVERKKKLCYETANRSIDYVCVRLLLLLVAHLYNSPHSAFMIQGITPNTK